MPFAALKLKRLLVLSIALLIIAKIDTSVITDALLELFLIGRIPGTSVQIGFEAFFAGAVFFAWAIVTYNFTLFATMKIHDELRIAIANQKDVEEIAL